MSSKILIVGGATGLGQAIAERLSGVGDTIRVPSQTWVANHLQFQMEVRDPKSVADYLEIYGPFEYIVYTVGVNHLNYLEDLTPESFNNTMAVNAYGFASVLQTHSLMFGKEALKSAVAITSDAAHNPMRGSLAYCTSKAALEMIIKTVAREWMPHTRVNGVAPSVISGTPMSAHIDSEIPRFRGWTPEQAAAYEATSQPMGRRVTPDEVAEVVEAVLFGPAYQTGSIIPISAGK